MIKANITGIGRYTPPLVTNEEIISVYGKKARILAEKIHHKTRYWAIDVITGKTGLTNTDMACEASKQALLMAGRDANDIDLIIYSTATPDYPLPPCFTILQEKLGIKRCTGFDIRSGCSGFGNALITAQQFISNGNAKAALVVGADLNTTRGSFHYLNMEKNEVPLKILYNMMLFGDAAGAVVLEASDDTEYGIFGYNMGSSKAHMPFGSVIQVGGSRYPFPSETLQNEDWVITQDGKLTEELIVEVLFESLEEFKEKLNIRLDFFDTIIFPVDIPGIQEKVEKHFADFNPQKIISIGSEGGSLANAAIPLSLYKAYETNLLKRGNNVLIYTAENTRWQFALIGMKWGRD